MKAGIIVFPGSNRDHDAWYTLTANLHVPTELIWHDSTSLGGFDLIVLPGGFSYGDYLRCGAIARFSPVVAALKDYAAAGGLVFGLCKPGALAVLRKSVSPKAFPRKPSTSATSSPAKSSEAT